MALPAAAEAILRRRTAQRFAPSRPLDPLLLDQILRLASFAPSAFNLQPWRFLVIRSERNRLRLQACAYRDPKIADAAAAVIVLGAHSPELGHLDEILENQVASGRSTPEEAAELRARATRTLDRLPDRSLWATVTAMRAVATLMIAAEAFKVASALIEPFDASLVKDAFGIPDDHSICSLVVLGWASSVPPPPGRLSLAELCFQEHFGQPWTLGEGSVGDT